MNCPLAVKPSAEPTLSGFLMNSERGTGGLNRCGLKTNWVQRLLSYR